MPISDERCQLPPRGSVPKFSRALQMVERGVGIHRIMGAGRGKDSGKIFGRAIPLLGCDSGAQLI